MENSRSKNAVLNILFGYIAQIGILALSLLGRRIFLMYLSVDYLGINGLYSNILTVLSLAGLGLNSAVVYSLYKPVAEDNKPLIASLVRYFRKVYTIIAIVIFALGLALIPFLKFIINSDLTQSDLVAYYVIFLLNTVSTYFVAHKVTLLFAYQEQRIEKMVSLGSAFVLQILHIIVLLIWKNYYVYIITTVFITIINCIILGIISDKIHPEIKKFKNTVPFDKKPIIQRIQSTFIYKIGAVAINSTDNILISIIVNTAAVGLYSNYFVIVNAIQGFIATITTSLISGIGNLSAQGSIKRQHDLFFMMLLFYHFIAVTGGVGFFLLFNDLISIWLGKEYLFSQTIIFAIALSFYQTNAISPIWMFREANGLFKEVKYLLLVTAFLNIILSIVFGRMWGIFGILIATTISRIITQVWYEPRILFRNVFGYTAKEYWQKQTKYFLLSCVVFVASYCAIAYMPHSFAFLVLKAALIVGISTLVFWVFNRNSEEYETVASLIKLRRKHI
jgi:O-antigen/teichoic acid export membrane protein